MGTATIVLVGTFGLLEIVGAIVVKDDAKDFVQDVVDYANVMIPILGGGVVLLYIWCVVAGTDTILHTLANRHRSAVRQYSVAVSVFQLMVILVGILAGLAIVVRAIAS